MPIEGIPQPEIVPAGEDVRLRRFDGHYDFAMDWYLDSETTYLVDGDPVPYTRYTLDRMYSWLNAHGELYFIEVLRDGAFVPVGDVTFSADDLPIVIGPKEERGRGTGRRVVLALIERARDLGMKELRVKEIYDYNAASIALFESCGFVRENKTDRGHSYVMRL